MSNYEDDRGPEETHPSYGLVSFSRITGGYGTRFFGSTLTTHHGFIELKVSRASVRHHSHTDWYSSCGKDELIEVWLTAAQFAQLITTMNVGEGVPCTIHSVARDMMPNPPESMTREHEKIHQGFKDKIRGLVNGLEDKAAAVAKTLARKSLRKTDRAFIQDIFNKLLQELRSNAPFVVECFEEAAEKVTSAAKAEVEAFVTLAAMKTGLDQLRNSKLSLGSGEEDK